eukprot:Partr_v1_DN28385_c2_g1_i1_m79688 putative SUMO1 sentrin specific peptidase
MKKQYEKEVEDLLHNPNSPQSLNSLSSSRQIVVPVAAPGPSNHAEDYRRQPQTSSRHFQKQSSGDTARRSSVFHQRLNDPSPNSSPQPQRVSMPPPSDVMRTKGRMNVKDLSEDRFPNAKPQISPTAGNFFDSNGSQSSIVLEEGARGRRYGLPTEDEDAVSNSFQVAAGTSAADAQTVYYDTKKAAQQTKQSDKPPPKKKSLGGLDRKRSASMKKSKVTKPAVQEPIFTNGKTQPTVLDWPAGYTSTVSNVNDKAPIVIDGASEAHAVIDKMDDFTPQDDFDDDPKDKARKVLQNASGNARPVRATRSSANSGGPVDVYKWASVDSPVFRIAHVRFGGGPFVSDLTDRNCWTPSDESFVCFAASCIIFLDKNGKEVTRLKAKDKREFFSSGSRFVFSAYGDMDIPAHAEMMNAIRFSDHHFPHSLIHVVLYSGGLNDELFNLKSRQALELFDKSAILSKRAHSFTPSPVERLPSFKRKITRSSNSESFYGQSKRVMSKEPIVIDEDDDNGDDSSLPPPPTRVRTRRSAREEEHMLFMYPFSGINAVTLTNHDTYRLDEGEFLNDSIIDFYLRYLMDRRISADVSERSYIYSSFFYKKLTSRKDMEAYDRVKKWTLKVDIFAKDFLLIPINEHAHWYLAIVLNPGNLLVVPSEKTDNVVVIDDDGETAEEEPKCTYIVICDSLGQARQHAIKVIKNYLTCEAQARKHITHTPLIKGMKGKLPVQPNHCDCGVYLLQYSEMFLNLPDNVGKQLVARDPELEDWFPTKVIPQKRISIRNLIGDVHLDYVTYLSTHKTITPPTPDEDVESQDSGSADVSENKDSGSANVSGGGSTDPLISVNPINSSNEIENELWINANVPEKKTISLDKYLSTKTSREASVSPENDDSQTGIEITLSRAHLDSPVIDCLFDQKPATNGKPILEGMIK